MSGKLMDDVDDDDNDDNEDRYRIRNQRRASGRGRGQVSDEGSRRGRGRGRARGSREFRRSRTDRSDSSSHSGQKPGEYSTQDVRRSHSESESSNQSMHMLEDSGPFETVQDRGFMNLTITATGDGTRHVETDCYSSFVNSVGAGGRRQDNKKKMNKKSSYGNQTREDERFQDVDDMYAPYQDRWYPEGGPREGRWEEQVDVPFKKKDKLKKHKKDCGERDGNMTNFQYAEDSSHFVEGGFYDQDQKYDGDAASSDSHKIKHSRKQKKKQRYQKELQDRSKPSKDYGYSGRFHQFADITYEDNGQRERFPDDSEGQIVQQSPQKERKSHVEESDRGLADVERGVAPSPQGRSHQRRNNPRGSSRGGGGDSRSGGRGRNKSGHYPGDGPAPRWNERYEQSPRSMSPRSSQGHKGEGNNLSGQHFQGKDYPSQQYQGHSGRDYHGRRNHPNQHAGARTGPPPNEGHRGNRNRSDVGQGQSRSGNSSEGQQTSEGHQSHGQKDRRKWNKKPKQAKFEHHLSKEEVADGLKRGTLIEGPIRVNQRNYSEAYVPLPDGTADIYISGLNNRNRALNGDIVAVQLLDKQEWKVYVDDLQSKEAKVKPNRGQGEGDVARDDGSDSGPDVVVEEVMQISQEAKEKPQGENHKHKHATPRKMYTSLGEVMSQGSPQARALMGGAGDQGDAGDGDKLLQRTAKVVAVVEAKHSRVCSGHIKLMQDRNRDVALFSPTDSRVPRIQVPMSECPKDFFERPDDHAKTLFIARITEWDNSMFAKGHLSRSLGEAGQIEPETEAILLEHNVESDDFPEEVLTCLPTSPWVIPESEFEYRQDLRRQCIFTIDPSTARDLDDAMSIEDLGNGSYKVGVHIADVSFFLDEGTPLDIKAASRATSVYLVQKVIPMLPRLLCEELCSLNPDKDRLTFSVFWTMDANGEIEDEWFGRTVIRSCVKCSYDHAQGFIENPDREWRQEELPPITNGFVVEDIRKRVLQLDKIAKCLRKKRFDSGALRLDQVKLTFALDKDTGMPNGYSVYEQRDSNRLIEEFMLLANMAVAHKIYQSYPQKAVLRRHPPPQSKMVDDLKDLCEQLGLPVDLSNSLTWQQSLSNYQGTDEFSAARMQVLVALSSKPMQNAKYFCSGMIADPEVYHHYALNVPLYTHFTSPIRRYADVLVHRLLAASLAYCRETSKDHRLLHKQADHCNDKKYMAKRVQEMSSEMFFAAFVKEVGPFEEKAMVMGVMDHSFDVFILKFGVSKRVYCDQLPLQSKSYIRDHKQPILTLVWAADDDYPQAAKQTLKIFTSVTICMMGDNRDPLKWKAILKRPTESC
ncbi:DIS3-like exonuclease 2 isoform X1 [Haliotis cracherodii]|uniref:DIS3-like exonuclease 2 isoform X1 n=1 Tax=Haliotis cracherodii TaxID=6455 RepID=UPI0039EA61AE